MSEYFPRIFGGECEKGKVEWDLYNYATKPNSTVKAHPTPQQSSAKSEVDKSDIDKLQTTPVDLSKLYGVVKNEVVKITIYDELVQNVNVVQTTSDLVTKTDCNTKIAGTERKILDHNHSKYIITQEFNKSRVDNFAERLAQENLATKADIDDVEKTDFDDNWKI